MKFILALGLLTTFAHQPSNEYPMRVRIVANGYQRTLVHTKGHGYGNLFADGKEQGFEYVYEHCAPFRAEPGPSGTATNPGPAALRARWGDSQSRRLVVELRAVGSDDVTECTLRISLRRFIYFNNAGAVDTMPLK